MSNELNNIVCLNADGVYEGVAIGGDRLACVSFRDNVLFSSFRKGLFIAKWTVNSEILVQIPSRTKKSRFLFQECTLVYSAVKMSMSTAHCQWQKITW